MSAEDRTNVDGTEPDQALCVVVPHQCHKYNLGQVAASSSAQVPVLSISVGLLARQAGEREIALSNPQAAVDLVVRTAQALAIEESRATAGAVTPWVYLHNCRISPDFLFARLAELLSGAAIDLSTYNPRDDRDGPEQHLVVHEWTKKLMDGFNASGIPNVLTYSRIAEEKALPARVANLQRILRYAVETPSLSTFVQKEARDFLHGKGRLFGPKLPTRLAHFKTHEPDRLVMASRYAVELVSCLLSAENKGSLINTARAMAEVIKDDGLLRTHSVADMELLCLPPLQVFYDLLACVQVKEQAGKSLLELFGGPHALDEQGSLANYLAAYLRLAHFIKVNKAWFAAPEKDASVEDRASALVVVEGKLAELCKVLNHLQYICSRLYRLSDIEAPFGIISAVNRAHDMPERKVHLEFYYPPLGLWADSHLPTKRHKAPSSMAHAARILAKSGADEDMALRLAQKSVDRAEQDNHVNKIIRNPPPLGVISWNTIGLSRISWTDTSASGKLASARVMPLPETVAAGKLELDPQAVVSSSASGGGCSSAVGEVLVESNVPVVLSEKERLLLMAQQVASGLVLLSSGSNDTVALSSRMLEGLIKKLVEMEHSGPSGAAVNARSRSSSPTAVAIEGQPPREEVPALRKQHTPTTIASRLSDLAARDAASAGGGAQPPRPASCPNLLVRPAQAVDDLTSLLNVVRR
jgi:hypothetical protein